MDYDGVLRLWEPDGFTAGLVDRKVEALKQVARHNASGYRIADLTAIRDVLTSGFSSLEEYGEPFVAPLCDLLSIFGLPYRRAKAHEERSNQAVLVDIIRVVVAVLVWEVPDIQIAAAQALEKFVRAEGFDDGQQYTDETGCWRLHQRLLLESGALNGLLVALRHHLALYIEAHGKPASPPSSPRAGDNGDGDDALVSGSYGEGEGAWAEEADAGSDTSRPRRGASPTNAFSRTYAVRTAAVRRAPEVLNILSRIVKEASYTADNALALNRIGAPTLLMSIIAHFTATPREPLLHTSLETVWNMLEHSAEHFALAAIGGDAGHAALNLADLLDKHRHSNAVRQLGTPRDVLALGALLESCVAHARTKEDKEFRNDVLVVLSLLARKQENRALFASTGVLSLLLSFGTAPEMLGGTGPTGPASVDDPLAPDAALAAARVVEVPLDRYATGGAEDVEFKQLCWTLIVTLTQGPYADYVVMKEEGGGEGGETGVSCISLVRSSPFLSSLLIHIDPAMATPLAPEKVLEMTATLGGTRRGAGAKNGVAAGRVPEELPVHPYLASLPPAFRRSLEIMSLDFLTVLAPVFAQDMLEGGALEILTNYYRTYTDVLNGAAAAGVGSAAPAAQPPSPTKLSHRQHKLLRETAKTSMSLTGTMPGAARGNVPFMGKHDTGRQYGALRLLHALLDMGTRNDPDHHLSSLVTAGVPTVVANTRPDPRTAVKGLQARDEQAEQTAVKGLQARDEQEEQEGSEGKEEEDQQGGSPPSPSSSASPSPDSILLGVRVACRLGELGLGEDLVAVLKALPAGTSGLDEEQQTAVAPADKLTYSAFGRTWAGVTGDGGLARTKTVASSGGHGQGVTAVTEGVFLGEGKGVVRTGMLKEEVLACLAGLTRTAADSSSHASASLFQEMLEAEAAGIQDTAALVYARVLQEEEEEAERRAERERQAIEIGGEGARPASAAAGASDGSYTPSSPVHPKDIPGGGATSVVLMAPRPAGLGNSELMVQEVLAAVGSNQDRVRKVGGVSALLRELTECVRECRSKSSGEYSTSVSQPRVATVATWALRCCTAGNVRSQARFLADSGIHVLLDLAESAAPALLPVALTAIADLSRDPISHVCVRSWRSDLTGHSAGRMLLELWRKEEARMGVVHEGGTGALENNIRPLDGSDAHTRQLALFSNAHKPTAAAVKRIKPGGRQGLAGGMPGCGPASITEGKEDAPGLDGGEGVGDEELVSDRVERAEEDTVAFRALRKALRAAKLWQQVESAPAGGPMAQLASQLDIRHKIYACLQAVGFDDLDREVASADKASATRVAMGAAAATAAEKEGKKTDDDDDDESVLPAMETAGSVYSSIASSTHGPDTDYPLGQFPDLAVPHRVSLEVAKAYADFIRGAAWDDVQARMREAGTEPLPADAALLHAHLSATATTAERVRALQLIHARREASGIATGEVTVLKGVVQRKADEAEALLFNERTKRKPGVAQGKAFAGLNMEEKKAGWAARARMLEGAYDGYTPPQGMPAPTDDGVSWAQMEAVRKEQGLPPAGPSITITLSHPSQ